MTEVARVVACENILGECPIWHREEQALYWVDIEGKTIFRLDPTNGETASWVLPDRPGSMAFRAAGGFVIAFPTSIATWDPDSGAIETIVDSMPGQAAGTRLNDGRCDHQGRFVVSDFDETTRQPIGGLWRVELDGSVTKLVETGITVGNSICFSPDGATLYYGDTLARTIWAYDYDPAPGAPLGARRVVNAGGDLPGNPDGSVTDAEGYVWSARVFGSSLIRFAPDGTVDRVVELPILNPTCPGFGGPDLDTLYVTSLRRTAKMPDWKPGPEDGAIHAFKPGVKGQPEPLFLGC